MRGSRGRCTAARLRPHFIKDGDCSLWLSFGLRVRLFSSSPSFLLTQVKVDEEEDEGDDDKGKKDLASVRELAVASGRCRLHLESP